MASSMAKEARGALTKGYVTSPNRRSEKDKCSNNKKPRAETENRTTKEKPLYHGSRQGEELL